MISNKDKFTIYLTICLVTRITLGILFITLSEDDRLSFFLSVWSLFLFLVLLLRSFRALPWWLGEYYGFYIRFLFCTTLFILGLVALHSDNYAVIHKVSGSLILLDVVRGYFISKLHYKRR